MMLCYIKDIANNKDELIYSAFEKECRDGYNNTDNITTAWTVVSNSNNNPDVNLDFLKYITKNSSRSADIQGFIMISDTQPPPIDQDAFNLDGRFSWPPLIAYGNVSKATDIKPYCFNT